MERALEDGTEARQILGHHRGVPLELVVVDPAQREHHLRTLGVRQDPQRVVGDGPVGQRDFVVQYAQLVAGHEPHAHASHRGIHDERVAAVRVTTAARARQSTGSVS